MIIDDKKYKNVLFVHIPKTAGTSIKHYLNSKKLDNWKRYNPVGHDPYFELESNNTLTESTFKFTIVRNPYTRTYSYYRHFNFQNNVDFSFEQFLDILEKKIKYDKTPMTSFPQIFYVLDNNSQNKLNKIYKFENIEEFESDFEVKLPTLREGNYSKEQYYFDYNSNNIERVKRIYANDFLFFGYKLNFI